MIQEQPYSPKDSYIKVATGCPEVNIADVPSNIQRISDLYNESIANDVSIITFPELSLTGYTLGDLVQQNSLLDQAETGLISLSKTTSNKPTALIVGVPLRVKNGLYNCAAVIAGGSIKGIVPKSNMPTYNEFYEDRWFDKWNQPNTTIVIDGNEVPFGTDLLFDIAGVNCGVEICEDLWVAKPPSEDLALKGARMIINLSASPEQVGKDKARRELVKMQSGKLIAGYIYAGCDTSESTAEIVMGGHQLIAQNGHILAERRPFSKNRLMLAEIDVDHLNHDRIRLHMANMIGGLVIKTEIQRRQDQLLQLPDKNPFLPEESPAERRDRLNDVIQIQAHGLAMRMKATHQEKLVLGLSGGLDSTLALLVAYKASEILKKRPMDMIRTLTMPGQASSESTQTNAQVLAKKLGVQNEVIPINQLVNAELGALGHDGITQDITFENIQARARTSLLFNYGNQNHAIVLGTGDLSEIALGWCTYNGDQQSHYNVNASIPKTMVRHLVDYMSKLPEFSEVSDTLAAIVDTPISPELTSSKDNTISQNTEDIIGPYELHDFFIWRLIRWADTPKKISYLAEQVFSDNYDKETVNKWFNVFIKRFATAQFKRENMPNGPKVGSVSLSPRGDWRMPPDLYNAAVWNA